MIFDRFMNKELSKIVKHLEIVAQSLSKLEFKLDIILTYLVGLEERLQEAGIKPVNKTMH